MSKEYYIKENRAVTCKRGSIGPGEKVTEKDFTRGKEAIDDLNTDKGPITTEKPKELKDREEKVLAEKNSEDRNAKALIARDAKIKVNEAKELLESADSKEDKKEAEKILSDAQNELRDLEK